MFTFNATVPAELHRILIPRLQAWINRADARVFGIATMQGLIRFKRAPWPVTAPTVVGADTKHDEAMLRDYAATL